MRKAPPAARLRVRQLSIAKAIPKWLCSNRHSGGPPRDGIAHGDEAAEDFELQGYLYASWHDDRLVIKGKHQPGETRTLDPDEVWNPTLDITNALTFRSFRESFVSFPEGTVFWEERFDAVLSDE